MNLRNYARMLKEFLSVEAFIVHQKNNLQNHARTIDSLKQDGYKVYSYSDLNELNKIASELSITHSYFMIEGKYQGLWVKNTINVYHSVFSYYEPFGDKHAYVSEWLYNQNLNRKVKIRSKIRSKYIIKKTGSPYIINDKLKKGFVPHCVYPEKGSRDKFFKSYNIPKDAFLIGRIGGYDQFNDRAAIKAVFDLLKKSNDIFFIFVNTKNFGFHPRIKYIDWMSYFDKWDFYDACDLLWNARLMGETFGFSIVEPLMVDKPIIGPSAKRNPRMDKNHILVLKKNELLYESSKDLVDKTMNFYHKKVELNIKLQDLVIEFKPQAIAKKFDEYFLGRF